MNTYYLKKKIKIALTNQKNHTYYMQWYAILGFESLLQFCGVIYCHKDIKMKCSELIFELWLTFRRLLFMLPLGSFHSNHVCN